MIVITNAQNIGFLSKLQLVKRNLTPNMQRQMKSMKWLHAHKRPHMDSNQKTQDIEWNNEKKLQYLFIFTN